MVAGIVVMTATAPSSRVGRRANRYHWDRECDKRGKNKGCQLWHCKFFLLSLAGSFTPSCCFGLSFGTEPAFSKALSHAGLRVIELPGKVINALTFAVYIALMTQSGEGAPSAETAPSRMVCALTGKLAAPKIVVVLFR